MLLPLIGLAGWFAFVLWKLIGHEKILETQPTERVLFPRAGMLDVPIGPIAGRIMFEEFLLILATIFILGFLFFLIIPRR